MGKQSKGVNMRNILVIMSLLIGLQTVNADDPSEKGVPTSPLTTYSGGLGVGAIRALNDSLRYQVARQMIKVSIVNTLYIRNRYGLFLDFDWSGPGPNFGANVGFDFYFLGYEEQLRPFIGFGVGGQYFHRPTGNFDLNFGPSGIVHIGFTVNVNDRLQIRFRIPYQITADETFDETVGVDVGFLFSDKYRKVKKLNYN
jgi:hypothetical protein